MTRTIAFLLSAALIQPAAPQAGPWKSLFDGKSMNAWRIFKTDTAPKMCDAPGAKDCWEIANGVWLNGKKVASYDVGSADWDAAVKASKFNPEKYPNFGKAPKGYLGIQGDHPGTLELRNIRIRDLQ